MGWLRSFVKLNEAPARWLGLKEWQWGGDYFAKKDAAAKANQDAQKAAADAAATAKAQEEQTAREAEQQRLALANLQNNAAQLAAANQENNAQGEITQVVAGGGAAEQLKRRKGTSIAGLSSSLGINA